MRGIVRFALGLALLLSALVPGLIIAGGFVLARSDWTSRTGFVLIGLAFAGIVAFAVCLGSWQAKPRLPTSITESKRADYQLLVFINSYAIPLAVGTLNTSSTARVSSAVLAAFLALMYVQGRMFHLNPLFVLTGYRLYECKTADRGVLVVLSRADFMPQRGEVTLVHAVDVIHLHVRRSP